MSPKILLEKNKERENRESEEKEGKRRKKSNGCTLSFYVSSAKDLFMGPGTRGGGGGGTPIHYLYGYVPSNVVVILKLLI